MNRPKIRRTVGPTRDSSEFENAKKPSKAQLSPIILRPASDPPRKVISSRDPSFLKRCALASRTQSQSFTLRLPPKSSPTAASATNSASDVSAQSGHIHIHVHTPPASDQQGVTLTSTFQQARTLTFSPPSVPTLPHKSQAANATPQQNSDKCTPKYQRVQKRPSTTTPSTPPSHKRWSDDAQESPGPAHQTDEPAFQTFMKKSIETIMEKLTKIEQQVEENNMLLGQITKRKHKVQEVPKCLPFFSISDLLAFENADDATYDEVVNFFVYLGGLNPTDSAARYFKTAFDVNENLLKNLAWCGSMKVPGQMSLKKTRFARACEEALARNSSILSKPNHDEFVWVMSKAIKSMKERLRRKLQRENESQAEYDGSVNQNLQMDSQDVVEHGRGEDGDGDCNEAVDYDAEFYEEYNGEFLPEDASEDVEHFEGHEIITVTEVADSGEDSEEDTKKDFKLHY